MPRLLLLLTFIIFSPESPGTSQYYFPGVMVPEESSTVDITAQEDTLLTNQLLYNGRVWIGTYFGVIGTEFMLTPDWINGDVTINGTLFTDVPLKYDIYNDDLLINYINKRVLILNREMVESFVLHYEGKSYTLTNHGVNQESQAFYQLFYSGKADLLKQWRKKRVQFAVEARYDQFQQDSRLLLSIDGKQYEFSNIKSLCRLFGNYSGDVRSFMRKSRIKVDIDTPEGLIPVLEFYDNLISE
ncbi:MAG: hypothetical protein LC649_05655 [Bacteroidales bacterium]|nr:hypothetical protein [Bacteroidales bacterium]